MKILVEREIIKNAHKALVMSMSDIYVKPSIASDIAKAEKQLASILLQNPFDQTLNLEDSDCINSQINQSTAIKPGTSVFVSTLTDTSRIRKRLLEQYQGSQESENITNREAILEILDILCLEGYSTTRIPRRAKTLKDKLDKNKK